MVARGILIYYKEFVKFAGYTNGFFSVFGGHNIEIADPENCNKSFGLVLLPEDALLHKLLKGIRFSQLAYGPEMAHLYHCFAAVDFFCLRP
ncbi:hypothetical protein CDD81_1440 [Ophiocordyceps australis]|uniref:Uncharacterized protein n=1 Tax=Ophiocordyceps australis TaxID=1399860 RepID=A0A2C5Y0T8_9HYPO|nr:hypothetical protein CDD81_1440 [Ophiocordyceps australis]